MSLRQELAKSIYESSHLTGEFLLRSGAVSNEYFDKYRFESEPTLLRKIAKAMCELIPSDTEVLAGLELGGIPVVTVLSQVSGLPAVFVRKQAKDYGTRNLAEGCSVAGRNVLIVEDVVTSGGQIALSAKDLKDAGAKIPHVVCVIDREAGGADNLRKDQLALHALFTLSELKEAAEVMA